MITVEEVLQGALAQIEKSGHQPSAYQFLDRILNSIEKFNRLPFTDQANQIYQSLPANIKRMSPQDCRIAAIAHVYDYAVVTRNQRDFQTINLAPVEDWYR